MNRSIFNKIIKIVKNCFSRKKVEPTMLAHYILWYNRDNNWFERLWTNKQIELLLWNPVCFSSASCVQSAGGNYQKNEHIPIKHEKIDDCETASVV
jgi:hypothetical protein